MYKIFFNLRFWQTTISYQYKPYTAPQLLSVVQFLTFDVPIPVAARSKA